MQRRSLFRISASLALLGSGFGLAACGGGDGDPATEPGPPAPPAPPPAPVMRTFAYVANVEPGGVSAYRVGADGGLSLAGTVPTGEATVSVVIHPSGRFAYAVNEESSVSAFTIDARTGMLSPAGAFAEVDPPMSLCFHPGGEFAYGNLSGGAIAIYSVDLGTGALGQPVITTDGANVFGFAVAPSGQVLFVARADDTVTSYRIAADGTGSLMPINTVVAAASPSSMAVAPSGGFLYVAGQEGDITVHAIDTTGALQGGDSTPAGQFVGALAIERTGRFAYAVTAVPGVPGVGYRVSTYTIDPVTGALTETGTSPVPDEVFDMAIGPSGQHVYVTRAGFVSSYTIWSDGALTEDASTAVSNPAGITIVNITEPVSA